MFAELKHTLRRQRGQIIGWSIGLALYGVLMASLFDSMASIEGFEELMAQYPKELMAFFGDVMGISTPKGYLDLYYFSLMPVVLGIFAAIVGAGLLVSDEEKGILDLIMAHPISRTALFWGRLLGFVVATIVILLVGWLSWLIPSQGTGLDLTWIEFLRPFVPLFAVLILFGNLAVLFSLFVPSSRVAGMLAGGLLVANYLLLGLANTNEDLEAIMKYSPLHFNQAGDAITGLDYAPVAGLLAGALLFALLAWWLFQRRDIRVGGEGGWQLPKLRLGRGGSIENLASEHGIE